VVQSCCVMLRLTLHSISSALKVCPTMLAVLCGITMVGLLPPSTAQTTSTPRKHALKAKARTTQAPAPTPTTVVAVLPPAVRLAPKETPPVPPQVLWNGSQLTIITNNSTLADILALVHAHTGADIDMPESASRQQMAARLGPGPVREVLSSLLSWTGFNYVIQASDKNPDSIQSILLIPRPKDAVEVATTRPVREEEYRQASEPTPDVAEAQNPLETPVSTQTATAVEAVPAREPPAQPATGANSPPAMADLQSPPAGSQTAATTPESSPTASQTKLPAQMLDQLQSMYQQRLQIQENQKLGNGPTP
jgi:hypothetical protein